MRACGNWNGCHNESLLFNLRWCLCIRRHAECLNQCIAVNASKQELNSRRDASAHPRKLALRRSGCEEQAVPLPLLYTRRDAHALSQKATANDRDREWIIAVIKA